MIQFDFCIFFRWGVQPDTSFHDGLNEEGTSHDHAERFCTSISGGYGGKQLTQLKDAFSNYKKPTTRHPVHNL